jgi:hypothetical protein
MGQNRITVTPQIEYNFNVALAWEEIKTVRGNSAVSRLLHILDVLDSKQPATT